MNTSFYVALLTCFLGFGLVSQAQTIDDDIRHLMAVNGSASTAKAGIKNMLSMMQTNPAYSTLPPDFWPEAEKEFTGPAFDQLMKGYIPIYKKHFSSADIRQLVAFYESPIGKKFVAEAPAITQESMTMGSEWGRALGETIVRKIAEKQKKN